MSPGKGEWRVKSRMSTLHMPTHTRREGERSGTFFSLLINSFEFSLSKKELILSPVDCGILAGNTEHEFNLSRPSPQAWLMWTKICNGSFSSLWIIVWEGDVASHRPNENCSAQPFCCPAREAQLLFSLTDGTLFETRSLGPQSTTTTALLPLIWITERWGKIKALEARKSGEHQKKVKQ